MSAMHPVILLSLPATVGDQTLLLHDWKACCRVGEICHMCGVAALLLRLEGS